MRRAPAIASFVLFLLLCASLAYWVLQWLAPPPRPVAAPPQAERALPPVAAAANLFGGHQQAAGMANVQLRGIIRAGNSRGSVAIIAAEGKPVRALGIDAEVLPGLTVKKIGARSVLLSDRGAERELVLPAFAAQESAMSNLPGRTPEPPPPPQPPPPQQQAPQQPSPPQQQQAPQQQAPQPPPQVQPAQPTASGPSSGGTTAAGGPAQPPNAQANTAFGQRLPPSAQTPAPAARQPR